jgi:hypothetical protein
LPSVTGKRYEEWKPTDPAGKNLDEVRDVRDEIDGSRRCWSSSS